MNSMLTETAYTRRVRSPSERVPDPGRWPSLAASYAAVRDNLDGFVAAWKLGGTNEATRVAFGVNAPYFGPLYISEVFPNGATVTLPMLDCKAEVEIALRIGSDGFDAWCHAAEMPNCAIPDVTKHGVEALVADRCAAGALILGPARALGTGNWAAPLRLRVDGTERVAGDLTNLLDDPIAVASDFLRIARANGFAPTPGQWIATGGITPCIDIPRKARISIVSDRGSELTFETAVRVP